MPPAASPAPPTASPAPPSALSLSAQSLNLNSVGSNMTFTATEPNYTGTLTLSLDPGTCASGGNPVATASPASEPGPSASFAVTAGNAPGTCKATVSDAYGQKQTISVVVTITQGALQ